MNIEITVKSKVRAEIKGIIPGSFVGITENDWSDRDGLEFVAYGACVRRYKTFGRALRYFRETWEPHLGERFTIDLTGSGEEDREAKA